MKRHFEPLRNGLNLFSQKLGLIFLDAYLSDFIGSGFIPRASVQTIGADSIKPFLRIHNYCLNKNYQKYSPCLACKRYQLPT